MVAKCEIDGCLKAGTHKKKFCVDHIRYMLPDMVENKCSVDFCPYIKATIRHCLSHSNQYSWVKDKESFIPNPLCSVESCMRISTAAESRMCQEHIDEQRRSRVFVSKVKVRTPCKQEGCDLKPKCLGFCNLHYGQLPHVKAKTQEKNARPANVQKRSACFKIWREKKRGNREYCAKRMWSRSKKRAAETGIEFSIELSDIIIPDVCPLLDKPLDLGASKAHDWSPSIDRIDSSKGYIPGNVWVVSWRANRIKNDATLQELETILVNLRRLINGDV